MLIAFKRSVTQKLEKEPPISKFLLTRYCLAPDEQKDGAHKYFEVFRMVPINQEPGATIVMGLLGCARVI